MATVIAEPNNTKAIASGIKDVRLVAEGTSFLRKGPCPPPEVRPLKTTYAVMPAATASSRRVATEAVVLGFYLTCCSLVLAFLFCVRKRGEAFSPRLVKTQKDYKFSK